MQIDNIEETEEFLKQMNYFFTNIEKANSDLKSKLKIKEIEQEDLLHEIEFSKLNAFELSKIATRLKNTRQERRIIKDKLEFMATIKTFSDKYTNKMITGDIAKLLKNIKDLKQNWNTRIYYTKVFDDLKISKMKEEKKNDNNKSR